MVGNASGKEGEGQPPSFLFHRLGKRGDPEIGAYSSSLFLWLPAFGEILSTSYLMQGLPGSHLGSSPGRIYNHKSNTVVVSSHMWPIYNKSGPCNQQSHWVFLYLTPKHTQEQAFIFPCSHLSHPCLPTDQGEAHSRDHRMSVFLPRLELLPSPLYLLRMVLGFSA